ASRAWSVFVSTKPFASWIGRPPAKPPDRAISLRSFFRHEKPLSGTVVLSGVSGISDTTQTSRACRDPESPCDPPHVRPAYLLLLFLGEHEVPTPAVVL